MVAGCSPADAEPAPTTGPVETATLASGPTTASEATVIPEPASPEPTPGQPCEPGSHPDCSDATGTENDSWRIISGYADCVEALGEDAAYGLCTDLDGDDQAGYPDAG